MSEYLALAELKEAVKVPVGETKDDALLTRALAAASGAVDKICDRSFGTTDEPEPRDFRADHPSRLEPGDFHNVDTVTVAFDRRGDGTFEDLDAGDWQAEPLNPKPGWPRERIYTLGQPWPTGGRKPGVRVTARWGWPEVPDDVAQATQILAHRLFNRKDAPEGVAGFSDHGVVRLARNDPDVMALLTPYQVMHGMLL